jgi:TPR repeat protein
MVDALLKQGKAMLSIGDISAARLLFTRAAESGNGEAALALGDTYNSVFLAEHRVAGPQADPESAKRWYHRAFALGEPRASERLARLGDDRHAEAHGSVNTQ